MMPLTMLPEGEKAEIVSLERDSGTGSGKMRSLLARAEEMGMRSGKGIEVIESAGRGPLIVKVDDVARFAVGRNMAQRIMVRRI